MAKDDAVEWATQGLSSAREEVKAKAHLERCAAGLRAAVQAAGLDPETVTEESLALFYAGAVFQCIDDSLSALAAEDEEEDQYFYFVAVRMSLPGQEQPMVSTGIFSAKEPLRTSEAVRDMTIEVVAKASTEAGVTCDPETVPVTVLAISRV